ncbi:MAG: CorA family divalent cation transporter [Trebonia sp.]
MLGDEFGLHPVAVEDALYDRERPKIDRYRTRLFLTAYGARLDGDSGELATSELSAFVLRQALITVRKDDGIDIGRIVHRWDASPDLAADGVAYLLHGLLDYIVDGHFEAVQSLDARGREHADAPRPAHRERRPDALLPGRIRPRAARRRVDRLASTG